MRANGDLQKIGSYRVDCVTWSRRSQAGAAPAPNRRGARPKSAPAFDQPSPLPFQALGRSRDRYSPLADPAHPEKTHAKEVLFETIQIPPDPQSKPGQANPSPAKPIQIKLLGFARFYSSESGLFKGLQRIPNKNIRIFLPSPFALSAQARLARRAFVF